MEGKLLCVLQRKRLNIFLRSINIIHQKMNICRICLSVQTDKDITQLPRDLEETKTSADILFFCLSIKVSPKSKYSTVCNSCYSKILLYYKFKSLALKNDEILRTISDTTVVTNEDFNADDIKCEETYSNNSPTNDYGDILFAVKDEVEVKEENSLEYQSEDELLSVIQKIKYENVIEDTKENVPTKKKKTKRKGQKVFKNNKKEKQICDVCGKAVTNLKEHVALHVSKPSRKKINCKACEKTFASYSARYRHYKIKHLGIKEHCDECNKDVVSLSSHQKLKHNRELLRFLCILCGRRFISQSVLDDHNLLHTKDLPYKCDLCDKAFRNKIYMLQHKRQVHEKEKSHLCQFCSKSFFKKYHLQVHLRSHTKERPYECNQCGKFYSSTSTLNNHKLIHTEYKKFACKICDMTFCKPNYLRNHMISHTKEKKFPCPYCGARFGRSDHRLRHQRTAHEQLASA